MAMQQCNKMLAALCVFITFFIVITAWPNVDTCGYNNCPKCDPTVLNVHLIAHTHDNVGWTRTYQDYSDNAVPLILDTVVQNLIQDPERRFIYVEMAFFWKWWQNQNETIREQVKELVSNGRLEFAGGAWCINDEATSNYRSTIDQTTWGFRKLNDTFGECAHPTIGWQIDAFGHSREQASLFSQFGYDAFMVSRIDYRDKQERLNSQKAEFLWNSSPNLGLSSEIFTSVFYDSYTPPIGFCFDKYCYDEEIDDDPNSPNYNADKKANEFLSFAKQKAAYYKSNNILIPMGNDFHFENATKNFVNIDKLIKAVNQLENTTRVFYSTPGCYIFAVNQANLTWSTKTDDFFPYASSHHFYWTGFYTSRPNLKKFERIGNNFLQIAKQVTSLTVPPDNVEELDPLREAMGVLQHHNAITGTETQAVADDYAKLLYEGFITAEEATSNALIQLFPTNLNLTFGSCLLSNISQCFLTESNDKFIVTIYNPLSRPVSQYIRLPVTQNGYDVFDSAGKKLKTQYVPIFNRILYIPGRTSEATEELVFRADDIPALGFKVFYVENAESKNTRVKRSIDCDDYIIIEENRESIIDETDKHNENTKNKHKNLEVNFDPTGYLNSITIAGVKYNLTQKFSYYTSGRSGAFVFEPVNKIEINNNVTYTEYDGPIVKEIHQQFNDWIGQIIRIYKHENYVEFNWVVGPIPTEDKFGKEIITEFISDLNNQGVFYTDTNGKEMITRVRNQRIDFDLDDNDPVTSNYYPVTSIITIKDESRNIELSILNDRAQGGSSIQDGQIELMVHRRILRDDGLGAEEPLNEEAFGTGLVATGKHYLIMKESSNIDSPKADKTIQPKLFAEQIIAEPWTFISTVDTDFNKESIDNIQFSGLKQELPKNIHILTLEPWKPNTLLLRLEHIFEKKDDPKLSQPETINIKNLFSTFEIEEIEELSLGANQLASEVRKLIWINENPLQPEEPRKPDDLENFEVTLNPTEIKTFSIKIKAIN